MAKKKLILIPGGRIKRWKQSKSTIWEKFHRIGIGIFLTGRNVIEVKEQFSMGLRMPHLMFISEL